MSAAWILLAATAGAATFVVAVVFAHLRHHHRVMSHGRQVSPAIDVGPPGTDAEALAEVRTAMEQVRDLLAGRLSGLEGSYRRSHAALVWLRAEQRQRFRLPGDPGGAQIRSSDLLVLDQLALAAQRDRYLAGEPGPRRVVGALVAAAERSLHRPAYSVVAKTSLPPSGDRHDYWNPAPYWWPNPRTGDGLPYVRRDGARVPGTRLWEPGSERYDRSALQSMIDETTIAALAGYFTGRQRYFARGADLLRTWFLDPRTRMNPHLRYAQVRRGRQRERGSASGIIEAKDFHYLLDAARILEQEEALTPAEADALRAWFSDYRCWLRESGQGRQACAALNNRGTWYDVQSAAIDFYLYDGEAFRRTLHRIQARLGQQFGPDGRQREELTRTLSQHYCAYNLQGWVTLAGYARRAGHDLWTYRSLDGRTLTAAVRWLVDYLDQPWPHPQRELFDRERLVVLAHVVAGQAPSLSATQALAPAARDPWRVRAVFAGSEGIRPFWLLGTRC